MLAADAFVSVPLSIIVLMLGIGIPMVLSSHKKMTDDNEKQNLALAKMAVMLDNINRRLEGIEKKVWPNGKQ